MIVYQITYFNLTYYPEWGIKCSSFPERPIFKHFLK